MRAALTHALARSSAPGQQLPKRAADGNHARRQLQGAASAGCTGLPKGAANAGSHTELCTGLCPRPPLLAPEAVLATKGSNLPS